MNGDAEINDSLDFGTIYEVKLDKFEGPLELLLHLIKKNELDIYDIPISIITKQYLEYLKFMKELNLEIAGEFLIMASSLLQIKSQMLLPSLDQDDPSAEEEDPRAELIRRLLEYQKFKEAAQSLENMDQTGRDIFVCRSTPSELEISQNENEIPDVELFELIEAFRSVISRIPVEKFHEVSPESINIADCIVEILSLIREKQNIRFHEIFAGKSSRESLIANFLALLELCKRKMIKTIQLDLFGEIWLTSAVSKDDLDNLSRNMTNV